MKTIIAILVATAFSLLLCKFPFSNSSTYWNDVREMGVWMIMVGVIMSVLSFIVGLIK